MAQGFPGWLRPRIFLTFRPYKGGGSSSKLTGRLYPRRNPWYSLSEAESTSGCMVLSGVPWKKSPVTPRGIDPRTVRLVSQCLNHYATPVLIRFFMNLREKTNVFKCNMYSYLLHREGVCFLPGTKLILKCKEGKS